MKRRLDRRGVASERVIPCPRAEAWLGSGNRAQTPASQVPGALLLRYTLNLEPPPNERTCAIPPNQWEQGTARAGYYVLTYSYHAHYHVAMFTHHTMLTTIFGDQNILAGSRPPRHGVGM